MTDVIPHYGWDVHVYRRATRPIHRSSGSRDTHVLLIWLASVYTYANGRRTKIWLPKSLQAEIGACWYAVKLCPIHGI